MAIVSQPATRSGSLGSAHGGRFEIAPGVWMPWANLGSGNHSAWLELGGRGIDTAYDYGDFLSQEIGAALRKSGLKRSEVFVITKIPCCPSRYWCTKGDGWWQFPDVGTEHADGVLLSQTDPMRLAEHNLQTLGLDYVDLIILHMPCDTPEHSLAHYRVLEEFHAQGKTRSIGVSNFNDEQLQALHEAARIKPAINQVGYNVGEPVSAWMRNFGGGDRIEATVAKAQSLGVTVVAYGPLGGTTGESVFKNPTVASVATRLGLNSAQVALRWLVQKGIGFVTASYNPKHLAQALTVDEFELPAHEMALLDAAHVAA